MVNKGGIGRNYMREVGSGLTLWDLVVHGKEFVFYSASIKERH